VTFTEAATGRVLRSLRLGVLQTAPGWAALSGIAAGPGGEEVPFSLILDTADTVETGGRLVLVSLGGGPWRSGAASRIIASKGAL
jgi:hypothetical protein